MLHTFRTLTGPIRKAGYFFVGSALSILLGTSPAPAAVLDLSGGSFFVGSVKEGTIYKGKVGTSKLEVFSSGSADGRSIATGMFFADKRLVVAERQTGLIFVYDTKDGHL